MVFSYTSLVSLIFVLLGSFLSGILPIFLLLRLCKNEHDSCKRNRILALLTYFGGGVFMVTCFLVLQPAANREYEKRFPTQCLNPQDQETDWTATKSEHKESLPIPEFVILCSFIFLFITEEIFQLILNAFQKKSQESSRKIPFCSCTKRHTECSRTFKAADAAEETLFGLEKQTIEGEKEPPLYDFLIPNGNNEATEDTERRLLQSSIISQAVPNYGAVANIAELNTNQPSPILAPPIIGIGDELHAPSQLRSDYRPYTTFFLLAIVLSVHNFFQGLSLGHSKNVFTWRHLIQTIMQFILSFTVGGIISQDSGNYLPVVCYIGLLCLMCPLGMSFTMIFESALARISHLAKAITYSTLCGSLLYLTFFDLLRGIPVHDAPSWAKFACFVLGSALVTILQYISATT